MLILSSEEEYEEEYAFVRRKSMLVLSEEE